MFILGYPLQALAIIASGLITFYILVILAAAICTWVNADPRNGLVRALRLLTEPALKRLRRFVPVVGGVDLSPLALVVILMFVQRGILPIIERMAAFLINA
jgi:YggT family protein